MSMDWLRLTRRFATWAVVILAALALTGVLVACFVGAQEGGSSGGVGPPDGTPVIRIGPPDGTPVAVIRERVRELLMIERGSLLHTTNRTHLSLCVDGAGGFSVSEAQLDLVRQALDDAFALVPSPPPEYGQPTVSLGCPPATALVGRFIPDDERWTGEVNVGPFASCPIGLFTEPCFPDVGASRDPSPHRLFVYFTPRDAYEVHFGTKPYFRTDAEAICHGDVCLGGVTQALYLPPSITAAVLREALLDNLQLRPLLQQQ